MDSKTQEMEVVLESKSKEFDKYPSEYEVERKERFKAECVASEKVIATALNAKKMKLVDTSAGAYFGLVCVKKFVKVALVGGPLVGLLSGIILSIVEGANADYPWYLTCLFGIVTGIAFMFIGRPVYGAILGALIYPIFWAICQPINKSRQLHNNAIDEDIKKAVSLYNENLEQTAKKDILNYVIAFEKEANQLVSKMENSETAKIVAEKMSMIFQKKIEEADRSGHIAEIVKTFGFAVGSNKIIAAGLTAFDFEKNRWAQLEKVEQKALSIALTKLITHNIKEMYSQNQDRQEYTITYSHKYSNERETADWLGRGSKGFYSVVTTATYTCSNKNYTPIKKW